MGLIAQRVGIDSWLREEARFSGERSDAEVGARDCVKSRSAFLRRIETHGRDRSYYLLDILEGKLIYGTVAGTLMRVIPGLAVVGVLAYAVRAVLQEHGVFFTDPQFACFCGLALLARLYRHHKTDPT